MPTEEQRAGKPKDDSEKPADQMTEQEQIRRLKEDHAAFMEYYRKHSRRLTKGRDQRLN